MKSSNIIATSIFLALTIACAIVAKKQNVKDFDLSSYVKTIDESSVFHDFRKYMLDHNVKIAVVSRATSVKMSSLNVRDVQGVREYYGSPAFAQWLNKEISTIDGLTNFASGFLVDPDKPHDLVLDECLEVSSIRFDEAFSAANIRIIYTVGRYNKKGSYKNPTERYGSCDSTGFSEVVYRNKLNVRGSITSEYLSYEKVDPNSPLTDEDKLKIIFADVIAKSRAFILTDNLLYRALRDHIEKDYKSK